MTRCQSKNCSKRNRYRGLGVVACALVGLSLTSACTPKGDVEAAAPQRIAKADTQTRADTRPDLVNPASEDKAERPRSKVDEASKSEDAAGGQAVSIAGGWVNAGGACDSGASVFFNSDGTYLSEGEKGTWALSGKTLTVTTASTMDEAAAEPAGPTVGPDESTGDVGEKAVLTLLSVTDDAARVVLSNGANANWTRCAS